MPTARTVHQHELDEGQELPAGGCPMATTRGLGPWLTCSRGLHGCPPGRDRVALGRLYPRPEQTRTSTLLPPGTATARAGASTHTPAGLPLPRWGPSSQAGWGLTCPCPAALGTPHMPGGGFTYRSALPGTVALGHVRSDLFSGEPLHQEARSRPQGSRLRPRRELAPCLARKHVQRSDAGLAGFRRVPSPLVGGGKAGDGDLPGHGPLGTEPPEPRGCGAPAGGPLTLMGRSSSGFR